MRNISNEEAKEKYGITTEHSEMDNGELRFRLKKDDGTCYIRTESPEYKRIDKDKWQKSHFHSKVKETYIVQKGWIGYVEQLNGAKNYLIYYKGDIFTTKSDIIHTIYMSDKAVVHTVKHGDSEDEKRNTDERTEKFDEEIQKISEGELIMRASKQRVNSEDNEGSVDYNTGYCHFDNLIWQVPAWSTAIFAVVLTGTSLLNENNTTLLLSQLTGLTPLRFVCSIYFTVGIFILVLSTALYRFRWHQINTKTYTPRRPLLSPQVGLQTIVTIQGFIFLLISSPLFGLSLDNTFLPLLVLAAGMIYIMEETLMKKGREKNKPVSSKS